MKAEVKNDSHAESNHFMRPFTRLARLGKSAPLLSAGLLLSVSFYSGAQDAAADRVAAPGSRFGLSATPSASDIGQASFFEEPLFPSRETTPAENRELAAAVERLAQR